MLFMSDIRSINAGKRGSFYTYLKLVCIALCISTALTSCGWYFTSDIAGYVKDSESENGIDGAVIRIYLEQPATADADGFIVETASATSSGNAGYFSHRVIWQNLLPSFGEEGDSNSLWLGITHEDYLAAVVEIRGILSDTVNLVPDVTLDRAGFSVPLVTGRVVDPSGDGVNGVRVVLDIPTTEEEEDYVSVTTDFEDEAGRYRFTDVSWRDDEAAGSGSDTEDVEVYIDDNQYSSMDVLTVSLVSDQEITIPDTDNIRASSDEFSVDRVWGRILDVAGEPLNGVRIILDLASTDGVDETEDYIATSATVDGDEGIYEFINVTWTDETQLGSITDNETATLTIDDNDYEAAAPLAITLQSGDEQEIVQDITVTRIDATDFASRLTGRCLTRSGTAPDIQDLPVRGVEVTCTWSDDDGAHTLYGQTDINGEYSFYIQWTDATPGDFLDGPAEPTIPAGEDGLIVEIVFAPPFNTESFIGATAGTPELPVGVGAADDDRLVKSWLNPNYAPDVINVP